MNYIVGILAMVFGLLAMAIQNYAGAYCCFGYALILWVVTAVCEYKKVKKNRKERETEMLKVLKRAIKTFGVDNQLTVAIEEFSELTKEICKHKRGMGSYNGILEEIADCYIMLNQLEMIFTIPRKRVEKEIENKVKRLDRRLGVHLDV